MTIAHREYVAHGCHDWTGHADGRDAFEILKDQGLQPHHRLLDFGCGSLRVGRWLIDYLERDRYFGIEPNLWLVEAATQAKEIPWEVAATKRPTFASNDFEFSLSVFAQRYDYVLINDVFQHAADHHIAIAVQGLVEVLETNGTALVNIILGPNCTGEDWKYPGISRHKVACVETPARAAGLSCKEVTRVQRPHHDVTWYRLVREVLQL